ncbi:MAG TPA: sigma-70 family RNA polymerase sigma factor [Acidimicrobiia bacterium]
MTDPPAPKFEAFYEDAEPRLRLALVAGFGAQRGREATVDALSYGWENWERVRVMDNPIGYLYRVGARQARRMRRAEPILFEVPVDTSRSFEPGLPEALNGLTAAQRQVVVLVYAMGYSHREVARLLGLSPATVQTHLTRGLVKLRRSLGVSTDV